VENIALQLWPARRRGARRGESRRAERLRVRQIRRGPAIWAGASCSSSPPSSIPRQQACPRRIAADGVKNAAASKITHARRQLAQAAAIQTNDL
jgi:hypothetical protein